MRSETAQAITAAITQGKRPEAGRLLQDYLRQNPVDEKAWLWLSQIADEPAAGAACLVRVLEIRAATVGLPGGHTALGHRMRRLADKLERPPPGPRANWQAALTWAARTLGVAVLLIVALVVGPFALGDLPIIIISGSMEPFIHTGSIVVAQRQCAPASRPSYRQHPRPRRDALLYDPGRCQSQQRCERSAAGRYDLALLVFSAGDGLHCDLCWHALWQISPDWPAATGADNSECNGLVETLVSVAAHTALTAAPPCSGSPSPWP